MDRVDRSFVVASSFSDSTTRLADLRTTGVRMATSSPDPTAAIERVAQAFVRLNILGIGVDHTPPNRQAAIEQPLGLFKVAAVFRESTEPTDGNRRIESRLTILGGGP